SEASPRCCGGDSSEASRVMTLLYLRRGTVSYHKAKGDFSCFGSSELSSGAWSPDDARIQVFICSYPVVARETGEYHGPEYLHAADGMVLILECELDSIEQVYMLGLRKEEPLEQGQIDSPRLGPAATTFSDHGRASRYLKPGVAVHSSVFLDHPPTYHMHRTVRVAVCRSMFLVKKRKASARSTKDDAVCLAKKLPFLAALTPASIPGQQQFSTVLVQVQVQIQVLAPWHPNVLAILFRLNSLVQSREHRRPASTWLELPHLIHLASATRHQTLLRHPEPCWLPFDKTATSKKENVKNKQNTEASGSATSYRRASIHLPMLVCAKARPGVAMQRPGPLTEVMATLLINPFSACWSAQASLVNTTRWNVHGPATIFGLETRRDETRYAYGLRTSDDDDISGRAPVDVLLADAALHDIEGSAQPILCPAPGTIASAPSQPPYIGEKDRTLRR
ncbi:hypothetical protein N5P37_007388, partial [Trichoderma harzianum]